MARAQFLIPAAVALAGVALSSLFVVDEREKALVLQFGQVKQIKTDPGLGFKLPLIQEVVTYDDRILSLPTNPLEVTPLDDRRLVVDAFARWRIVDLVKFREAVGAGGETIAKSRLDGILNNAIREVMGSVPSTAVLSDDRTQLMNRIRDIAKREANALGVDVKRLRYAIYAIASLVTAVAVTSAGSIGFIGLIVPHLVRLAIGNDQRLLLPASVLAGGALLVFADTLARTIVAPQQLPVGVLTALIGVPVFLFLLARHRQRVCHRLRQSHTSRRPRSERAIRQTRHAKTMPASTAESRRCTR